MRHNAKRKVTVVLAETDFADLIDLLETRIKSERARAAAFKSHRDHSNHRIACGRMTQLLELRNALASGCHEEVDDV
jgi:hypothetical protein